MFNPIVPITFAQRDWQAIDFGVALVFLVAIGQELMARARSAVGADPAA